MNNAQLTAITRKRYQRNSAWYDKMGRLMEKRLLPWRKRIWELATGPKILEVGIGTGRNLALVPSNFQVTGIDLTPGMLEKAQRRAAELGVQVDLQIGDVQRLTFADASFDTIIATCVFCSVPDPILGFREIKRVLKPKGKLILLEHMRSPNPVMGKFMDLINPLMVRLMGANINRRTLENIQSADLEIKESEDLDRSGMFKFIVVGKQS